MLARESEPLCIPVELQMCHMPDPLNYATPDLNRRKPLGVDLSVIILGIFQLMIAGILLASEFSGSRLPVRNGRWYVQLAYHWPGELGVLNVIANTIILIAAFGPTDQRKRKYRAGASLILLGVASVQLGFYILSTVDIYLANGPVTVPVNDMRYSFTKDDWGFAEALVTLLSLVLVPLAIRVCAGSISDLSRQNPS